MIRKASSPIISDIERMSIQEREQAFLEVFYSPANFVMYSRGHILERVALEVLECHELHAPVISKLGKLDGQPVYDLGCGLATGMGVFLRWILPHSQLIGVDLDERNGAIRAEIAKNWDHRYEWGREIYDAYHRAEFDELSPVQSVVHFFWGPGARSGPRCKETFELDEFRVGDFNHLDLPDGLAGVVFTNFVVNDIPEKTRARGYEFRLEQEIERILRPGGLWVTSGPSGIPLNIAYEKPQ